MMKIKYLYNSTGSTDNQKVLLFFCSMLLSCSKFNSIQDRTGHMVFIQNYWYQYNHIYLCFRYDIYCFYWVKFLPRGVVVHPFDVGSSIDSWW